MVPGDHAEKTPTKPAYIMAASRQVITYRELEEDANRIAHMFRRLGYQRGDSIAVFSENHEFYFKICWAAQRAGLYYTCISSYLTAEEVDYIVGDCGAKGFITSAAKSAVASELLKMMPGVRDRFMVQGTLDGYLSLENEIAGLPATMIENPSAGADMLYSSGTTGRPKGVRTALPEEDYGYMPEGMDLFTKLYGAGEDTVYLSPAPLYHAAPLRFNMAMQRLGATCVVMEKFDPELAIEYIGRYQCTHSQWVPTMFVRMLKLPIEVRQKYDVSSMKVAIHAAAPCPTQVKYQMIDWWGPVINEYYAGTEGNGFVAINSEQWLAKPGSVGVCLNAVLHIVDDEGNEVPAGQEGTIYFSDGGDFEYYNDPEKTAESKNDRGWTTLGDVGYVDEDGFLFLTDRKAYMIISGGVNIYPQEIENLMVTHPEVMDVAVIGAPNEEFGEEVTAIVQPVNFAAADSELRHRLLDFCREHLSHIKCPRVIDFERELPRHENGKLYKRLLRDRYWTGHNSRIV